MQLEELRNEFLFHIQQKGYTPRMIKGYKDNVRRSVAHSSAHRKNTSRLID